MQIQTFQTKLQNTVPRHCSLQATTNFPLLLQINEAVFKISFATHLVYLPPPLPATPPTATHPSFASFLLPSRIQRSRSLPLPPASGIASSLCLLCPVWFCFKLVLGLLVPGPLSKVTLKHEYFVYISKTSLYTTFRMYPSGRWLLKILMFALLVTREIATYSCPCGKRPETANICWVCCWYWYQTY
jgi:hypothetical protein